MTLTLYMTPESAPVRAVLLAAAYLGISLDLKHVDLTKGEQLQPDFLKLNPQHTVPTLVDDGNVIWDSHAIMGYLVGKYATDDSVYPKDDHLKRAIIDQRMHFDTGMAFNQLHELMVPLLGGAKGITTEDKDNTYKLYGLLEKFLEDRKWMAGESLSLADFSLVTTVTTLDIFVPVDAEKYPRISAWISMAKETLPEYEEINEGGLKKLKTYF